MRDATRSGDGGSGATCTSSPADCQRVDMHRRVRRSADLIREHIDRAGAGGDVIVSDRDLFALFDCAVRSTATRHMNNDLNSGTVREPQGWNASPVTGHQHASRCGPVAVAGWFLSGMPVDA
jgi:hypothetical protein